MRCSTMRIVAGCWLPALVLLLLAAPEAQARRGYPSAAQIRAAQEQQRAQEEAEQKYQAALAAKRKEVLDRYDLNKNGKIDGPEKPLFDKYLREIKLGKQPDPLLQVPYPKVEVKKSSSAGQRPGSATK